MHSTLVTGTFLAGVVCAVAAPSAANPPGHGVKINQVAAGKVFRNGAISVLQTFEKFGKTPPSAIVAAAKAAQSGSVTATPEQYDSEYLCPVTIGSQTLTLDFDTGSSDLWVFSNKLPSSQTTGHTVYNTGSGTQQNGETFQIKYGDGSGASGLVYSDKVVVGGVTATSQAVEAATSVSAQFVQDKQNDGLLGLAFQSINACKPKQCQTFFNTIEPTLAQPVFTADLKKGEPGSYTFGYIDNSLYTGNITYTPVNKGQGFWGFTAGGYSVGSNTKTGGSIGSAIADTGTSLLFIPARAARQYWAKVPGSSNSQAAGGYVFPCSGASKLPDWHVSIGGHVFTVPGSYMNYAPANRQGTQCFGGLQANTGIGFTIFGDIFLKSVYAIFEPNTPQIGFAEQS